MNITEIVAKIQDETKVARSAAQVDQMNMLENAEKALDSVGVSLESRFEIPLSNRTNPPRGYYRQSSE